MGQCTFVVIIAMKCAIFGVPMAAYNDHPATIIFEPRTPKPKCLAPPTYITHTTHLYIKLYIC